MAQLGTSPTLPAVKSIAGRGPGWPPPHAQIGHPGRLLVLFRERKSTYSHRVSRAKARAPASRKRSQRSTLFRLSRERASVVNGTKSPFSPFKGTRQRKNGSKTLSKERGSVEKGRSPPTRAEKKPRKKSSFHQGGLFLICQIQQLSHSNPADTSCSWARPHHASAPVQPLPQ